MKVSESTGITLLGSTGIGWDGASFLHSSLHGAVFLDLLPEVLITHQCFSYC